jgi:8-oxo-dGTP pyrophosphatase MutT (NUDIX family)
MSHDHPDGLARMNALAGEILGAADYLALPNLRPRDAAALILIDCSGPSAKVLLGRRHEGHAFMPGKFVFPGGRLEPADQRMSAEATLDREAERKLLLAVRRPSAAYARALALAAIRETYEETGLLLGRIRHEVADVPAGPWAAFAAAHVLPDLSALYFLARAITPPRRPRRFDTRFFAADAGAIAHRVDGMIVPDAELVELRWMPIAAARELDMPAITAVVLQELELRIAGGLRHSMPVPFYRMQHGRFVRELL